MLTSRENIGTPKLTKIEKNINAFDSEIKIFNVISSKIISESNFKRKILTPLDRRPSAFVCKQQINLQKESKESICLSKSYNLAEDNEKTNSNQENLILKNLKNNRLFLNTKENSNNNIRINLKFNNFNKTQLNSGLDLNADKSKKNLNAYGFTDVSNIGFQSTINKSFNNENNNFFLTPKNSLKVDEKSSISNNKSPTSNEVNAEKSFLLKSGRRLSNILQNHFDQSQNMNSLITKERNDSKFLNETTYANSNNENENEKNNYLEINKILSDTKLFAFNENPSNIIRFNRNKLHLNNSNTNQHCAQRSFDFEKNKYKQRLAAENVPNSSAAATQADETNKTFLENLKHTKSLKLNKLNLYPIKISTTNNEDPEKTNAYKINVIEAFTKRKPIQETSNCGNNQIQDMSTTVFEKSEQVSKLWHCEFQTHESKLLNETEIVSENNENKNLISNDFNNEQAALKVNDFISSSFKRNFSCDVNNNNLNYINNSNTNIQLNKNGNKEGLSLSVLKSISAVTQNKNLLENSFESNSNNNTVITTNNVSQIINNNNNMNNISLKNPYNKDLNSIEETHFNFVLISQASKKIMKVEDVNYNNQENYFNTVIEVNGIDFH